MTCWSGPILKLRALGQAKWKGQVTNLFCHTILCYGFWMSWVWTDQRWILENFSGTKVGCVASKAIGKHDLKSAFDKKLAFYSCQTFSSRSHVSNWNRQDSRAKTITDIMCRCRCRRTSDTEPQSKREGHPYNLVTLWRAPTFFGCALFRDLWRCSQLWSMGRYSAATPTSCACRGRAGFPRARRRSPCAASATTRKAGSPLGTAEASWASRLPQATAGGTGPRRRESTLISEDITARWEDICCNLLFLSKCLKKSK